MLDCAQNFYVVSIRKHKHHLLNAWQNRIVDQPSGLVYLFGGRSSEDCISVFVLLDDLPLLSLYDCESPISESVHCRTASTTIIHLAGCKKTIINSLKWYYWKKKYRTTVRITSHNKFTVKRYQNAPGRSTVLFMLCYFLLKGPRAFLPLNVHETKQRKNAISGGTRERKRILRTFSLYCVSYSKSWRHALALEMNT